MKEPLDHRALDEWIYSLNTVAEELEKDGPETHALELLRQVLDAMRDRRAELRLKRHNATGY